MYERLTKWEFEGCASVNGCSPIDKDMANAINRLCALEDKICEGKIVELPCETGSKVWFVAKKENDEQFGVIEGQVGCFRIESYYSRLATIHWTDYQETYRYIARFEDFGKTVFLTTEEANKKLKELENE